MKLSARIFEAEQELEAAERAAADARDPVRQVRAARAAERVAARLSELRKDAGRTCNYCGLVLSECLPAEDLSEPGALLCQYVRNTKRILKHNAFYTEYGFTFPTQEQIKGIRARERARALADAREARRKTQTGLPGV